ncbi:calcium-binding protein E63-1 [Onthophagus taurus]|uniref:calcium-binding protein E63-1 n=1 Tax=Onthophagus taurus TaxID=166361 RepID=UPI000C20B70F|nr:calcium-binding protein E63-1 [Onthophagus taurus]
MAKTMQRRRSSIKREFNEKELQDLRTAFVMLDSNSDGKVTTDDLQEMLKRLGIEVRSETVEELVQIASHSGKDIDENDFLEFVKKVQELLPERAAEDAQQDLLAAFQVFDLDNNGYITRDELKIAMEKIGEPVTEEQITQLITMADVDLDGKINYEEFSRLLI